MINSVYFSLYVQLNTDTWREVKYHIQRCRTYSACTHIFSKYMPLLVYFIYMLHIIYNTWLHVCPRAFHCCSYIIYEHRTLAADFHGMKTQQRVCSTPTMTRVQRPLPLSPSMSTATCCFDTRPRSAYDLPIYNT